jgi:hypothetical protein
MSSWEIEVPAITGDNSVPINAAIAFLSANYGGGTVYLDPAVYTLTNPILGASGVMLKGAFNGSHLFSTAVSTGTILRWTGAAGGTVLYDAPATGADHIDGGGASDFAIDGAGVASIGLQDLNSYCRRYARIHTTGVTAYAYYLSTVMTTAVNPNYHTELDSLTAAVFGGAHGIVLDGTPGAGRNTCFVSARNCHMTYQNGVAYCLSNCDDCGFVDCACSRMTGGTGTGIYFGGSSDGSGKCAIANRFLGWNSGGLGAISASGGTYASRGNYVLANGEDGLPVIYQATGSTITVDVYDGEPGFNGFCRNPLKTG